MRITRVLKTPIQIYFRPVLQTGLHQNWSLKRPYTVKWWILSAMQLLFYYGVGMLTKIHSSWHDLGGDCLIGQGDVRSTAVLSVTLAVAVTQLLAVASAAIPSLRWLWPWPLPCRCCYGSGHGSGRDLGHHYCVRFCGRRRIALLGRQWGPLDETASDHRTARPQAAHGDSNVTQTKLTLKVTWWTSNANIS